MVPIPIILGLRQWMEEDQKLIIIFGYIQSSRLAWATVQTAINNPLTQRLGACNCFYVYEIFIAHIYFVRGDDVVLWSSVCVICKELKLAE